ncbi:PH domain-containing protein [Halorubrum kocurii]|uniref:PH domain-containing protein n=1 Tax=Halorubrum kocurii TaxID=478441 RepID=UPI0009B5A970|nr:PH domain-containing protein [Halorubrum kocurii]
MGIFSQDDNEIVLENADLDCSPQGKSVTKSNVAKIDQHLSPGEKVHYISSGSRYSINGEEKQTFNVRMVLTDKRIFVKRKHKLIGNEQNTFNYKDISSVNLKSGMVFKKLALEMSATIHGIGITETQDSDEIQAIVDFVREKCGDSGQNRQNADEKSEDPIDRIEKLSELNESGVISDEEFQNKKEKLMDQI